MFRLGYERGYYLVEIVTLVSNALPLVLRSKLHVTLVTTSTVTDFKPNLTVETNQQLIVVSASKESGMVKLNTTTTEFEKRWSNYNTHVRITRSCFFSAGGFTLQMG
jgi:hypothetical protein